MRKIILASQSKARKSIFKSLGIPFETIPAKIDEKSIRNKDLSKRAVTIAKTKAHKILEKYPDFIIIAADTFSESEGAVFEKPRSQKEAYEMLKKLSGKNALNYTGFCYIDRKEKIDFSTTVITEYRFRELYDKEIKTFVGSFPVTEWAAGFALVFPYINTFIESVNGSLTGLSYGFPTEVLIPLLKKSGFEPKPTK